MKRLLIAVALVIGLSFQVSTSAQAAEVIRSFDVRAELSADRRLQISETIVYDFGEAERHGIYRNIPVVYDRNGAKYRLRLSVGDATMDGQSVSQKITDQGDAIEIRLGDPDAYVTGRKTYVLTYSTDRAINDFSAEGERELYWNVTGDLWDVPIQRSSFVLVGPAPATKTICFTGSYGSTEQACVITQDGPTLTVRSDRPLDGREGLTVAVRYPASVMRELPWWKIWPDLLLDNVWLGLPVLVFAAMFFFWQKYGKDPAGRGTVIAQYEEPRHLPPGLLDALIKQEFSQRAVTGTILDLARRGYLKLIFQSEKEFTLHKLKEADTGVLEYEKTLFDGLFAHGDEVKIADKKDGSFWKAIQTARSQAFDELKNRGLFGKNPGVVRASWLALAGAIGFGGFFFSDAFGSLFILSAVLSAIIVALFGWQMPKKTPEGAIVEEEAEGFKMFLSVTERDRLDFTDAPERSPTQFARFLPAAVAFGVEEKWAKQFAGIQVQPPSYMEGNMNAWTALNFSHAIRSFHDSSVSGIYHNPSSAGHGGSGFSGGGGGGGFGGGGGGSW